MDPELAPKFQLEFQSRVTMPFHPGKAHFQGSHRRDGFPRKEARPVSEVPPSPTVLSVTESDLSVVSAELSAAATPELSAAAALSGSAGPPGPGELPGPGAEPPASAGIGIRVLGPVEAQIAGEPIPVAGARQLSVLAALALGAGRVVSTGCLARAVWDGTPPPTARAQIQGAITRLRRSLPGLIRTMGHGYLLAAPDRQVDAAVFRRLSGQACAAARDRRPAEAAALFRSALGLWRGDALDGVPGLGADAADLENERIDAVKGLFAAELGAGRHAQVIPDLYGYVLNRPWQEPLLGLLMLALYRCGRKTEALMAYADGCRLLAEHLGAEPGIVLCHLARAIRAQDPHLDPPSLPILSELAGIPLR
jgi:DNA-binding SARP family transcriptional activator